jgi:putative hydrolase of the HAD superfamily
MSLRAIIFDLGGTLIDWPDWEGSSGNQWGRAYDYFVAKFPGTVAPEREKFVRAMIAAELYHWQQVDEHHVSMPPTALVQDGSRRLNWQMSEGEMLTMLDGYGQAVSGWAMVFPDAVETLLMLRKRGYRLGLLSNTWWAAAWHDADLAAHGLTHLLDVVVYTSDLTHSKPHSSTFLTVTDRLGVEPGECVMVGDRMLDDVGGALDLGMRAVWKQHDRPWPKPDYIKPTAIITDLAELVPLVQLWEHA